jgi:hypothetical protein
MTLNAIVARALIALEARGLDGPEPFQNPPGPSRRRRLAIAN